MRPNRVSPPRPVVAALLALPLTFLAAVASATAAPADGFTIEASKEAPPAELAAAVRDTLAARGFRVLDSQGKPYAEIWLRKGVPATAKPEGAKGQILFPFLAMGELLGALRFPAEGRDNRDQAIARGVYTLRYGLQPVNGDHLGVSPYRDYALLLPAAKDTTPADLPKKRVEERSAESAGTSHPAILLLTNVPASSSSVPAMSHDEEKDTWSAALPLSLEVKGESSPSPLNVRLILIGVVGG